MVTGCTSVASSTAALMVALHSQKQERDTRRYKGIDRCFISDRPSPLEVGYNLFNGIFPSEDYQIILNPELKGGNNYSDNDLSYAYFYIAYKMMDSRAWDYMELVKPQLAEGRSKEVEDFIDGKYLQSYLTKCFDVPDKYKIRLKDRELIKSR
ncbi:MAG: hypothetical protein PQ612_01570 [Rickettsiales bacterium]|nr:hypothetical protein [Pseudomonadota bacterium]MDA0965395.1 hypothetical protein [Pseudomonadota bacterium]MDG4542720.1 hypothetical protein [Rickettsiales bacterium]MDG4544832.1 hypothetical protein [Rickettsiales bacterium]